MNQSAFPQDFWLIPKKWPKRLALAAVPLALILFLSVPYFSDYTVRARVSELILATHEARARVEEFILANPHKAVSLSAAALIPSSIAGKSKAGNQIDIAYREISERGEIKVFSPQLGVFVLFTPTVKEAKVSWSCWGSPKTIVPASCRGDK